MLIYFVFVIISAVIYMAFALSPPVANLGESSRIIFFHVPVAWVSILSFIISGIMSIVYLIDNGERFDSLDKKAHNSAVIGIAFTLVTVVTGSMWAKISWGSYWNWDPRETSIVFLLLIYIGYFSLHSALVGKSSQGKISGVYLIFSMVVMPFFVFVIPRIFLSLHPDAIVDSGNRASMEGIIKVTLMTSIFGFSLLYVVIFNIMNRLTYIKNRIEERYDEI